MKKYITIIVCVIVGFLIGVAVFNQSGKEKNAGGAIDVPQFAAFATSSQDTITTSSARLSATSTRSYAVYVNSGSNPVYLCFQADKVCTTATANIYLSPGGGSYEIIAGENEYTGSITALSTTGNSTINLGEIR